MRWSFTKMWACMITFAMFGIAFVGVTTTNYGFDAGISNDSLTNVATNDGTRGPGVPRVVLLERFTNVNCGPCTPASEKEDVFVDDHSAADLAVIKYHMYWPSNQDPMYLNNPTPQEDRRTYYGTIGYVPYAIVDGVLLADDNQLPGNYPITYNLYQRFYNQRMAIDSPFSIESNSVLGATTGTVWVNVTAVDTVPAGNLKVRMVLYFNNVQYPVPPGSNGEDHFEFVFMDFIPNINGNTLTISQGQTVSFVETFTIPTEIAAGGGDPAIPVERSQLGIVSMVQNDNTREVHQSSILPFADLAIDPIGIMVTPFNPNLGDTVGVSARVINNGEDISDAYVTAYVGQIGGNPIGPPMPTGPMAKGQMKVVGLGVWDTTGQPGLQNVYAKVDVQHDYFEADETNNVAMKQVNVAAQFDVGVSQIDPFIESAMHPMSNYSIDATMKNFGQNAMGDFDVTIDLYQLSPPDVPDATFADDMEGGIGGWTESGTMLSWQYGAPSPAPGAHSGSNVWATTLTGNYPTGAVDWLYSPTVRLPTSASSITLDFWHFYAFESTNWPGPPPPPPKTWYDDCGNFWMSTDSGNSWILMEHFFDNNGAWSQETYDLTSYAGQSVRFGFELVSDSSTTVLGWYIDDFTITSMIPTETLVWGTTTRLSTILAPGAVDSLIWNQKIITGGTHKLYISTPVGGDQNPANDQMTVTFDVDPTKWRSTVGPIATPVSSPLLLSDSDIASVVAPVQSTITAVRTYDPITKQWLGYDPTKPANSLSTVDHKMGMWVISDTDTYVDFPGTIPGVTVDIQLQVGWNLVGYPSMTDRTVADALMGVTYDKIEGYDPASPYHLKTLNSGDWMTAGQAYWIYVSTSAQTWSVDA